MILDPQDGISRCGWAAYLQIWIHHELRHLVKKQTKEKKRKEIGIKYIDIERKIENYYIISRSCYCQLEKPQQICTQAIRIHKGV